MGGKSARDGRRRQIKETECRRTRGHKGLGGEEDVREVEVVKRSIKSARCISASVVSSENGITVPSSVGKLFNWTF